MKKAEVKKIADKEAAKEVHKHEKHMHKGKAPTKLAKGGVAGVNQDSMKSVGRNLARAGYQRGG
jgi:hypothetical protein